jgi:hypothetical protein
MTKDVRYALRGYSFGTYGEYWWWCGGRWAVGRSDRQLFTSREEATLVPGVDWSGAKIITISVRSIDTSSKVKALRREVEALKNTLRQIKNLALNSL